MIKTKAQLQAAEKALSKKQMEILQEMRSGAVIKKTIYQESYHLVKDGKDLKTVYFQSWKKLLQLGFIAHLGPGHWIREWMTDGFVLVDLTWIKE